MEKIVTEKPATQSSAQSPPKPAAKKPPEGPEGTSEAKRRTAAVLEVLAGARSTTDAAKTLGVSLQRYYLLEKDAIAGIVAALEPKPRGRVRPDRRIETLTKEVKRLEREVARSQSLARAAQRTLGLGPTPKPLSEAKGMTSPKGKKKRVRLPLARGLKAASLLRTEAAAAKPASGPASSNGGAS